MENKLFEHKIMDFGKFSKLMENTELRFDENDFDLKDFLKTMDEMSDPKQIDTPPTASEDGTNQKLDDVVLDNLDNIEKAQGTANDNTQSTGTSKPAEASKEEKSQDSDDDKNKD